MKRLALALMLGIGSSLVAQERVEIHEDMVVTAQFVPESAKSSLYDVKVITREEIQATGSSHLGELLSKQLQVEIKQKSVFGASLGLQGVSHENVKIMVDGVPVVGRLNGIIDLNHINLANIERIEMIRGPVSVYYGSESLAGVVNLITRRASGQGLNWEVDGRYESIGEWAANTRADLGWDRHLLSVAAGRREFGGHASDAEQRRQEWNAREQDWIDLGYAWDLGAMDLSYGGTFFDEHLDDLGEAQAGMASDIDYHTRRWGQHLDLKGALGEHFYLDATVSYSDYQRDKSTRLVDLETGSGHVSTRSSDADHTTYQQWMMRTMLASNHPSSRWQYQIGVEASLEESAGRRILEGTQNVEDDALFVSSKLDLSPRWTIQPGLRYSHNSRYDAPLAPSLHLLGQLTDRQQLRMSYGRGFRAPSLKELFLDFTMPAGPIVYHIGGNPDLRAERGHHVGLAYRGNQSWLGGRMSWEGDAFYNRVEDLIALSQTLPDPQQPGLFRREYINLDRHASHGVELAETWRGNRWSIGMGLAHTGLRNELNDAYPISDYRYVTDANASVAYRHPNGLNLSLISAYHGKRPGFYVDRDNQIHETSVEAYHDLDLVVSHSLGLEQLSLRAGVKNLFDVENLDAVDRTTGSAHDVNQIGWGRTYFLSIGWRGSRPHHTAARQ